MSAALPVPATVPARVPSRAVWVDVAKGLSIVLVVVHHVVLLVARQHGAPDALVELSRALGTVRMPVFFLASGLFAGAAVAGPWGRLLHRRVVLFAWLYVVWTLVRHVVFGLLAHGTDVGAWPGGGELVSRLWLPASALWFVYALGVFSVVARLLVRVPVAVRLGGAAALSALVGSGLVPVESYAWRSMATYLVFFLLGVDASAPIRRAAGRLTVAPAAAGAAGLGVVLVAVLATTSGLTGVPGVRLGASVVAVGAGVCLAVALAGSRLGRLPAWLGARTLDIYLLHGLAVGLMAPVLAAVLPERLGAGQAAATVVVVTAAAVGASLVAGRALRAVHADWLFALPRRLAPAAARRGGDHEPGPGDPVRAAPTRVVPTPA